MKTTATQERIGRVGRRRQVVLPQEIFENLDMRADNFVAVARAGTRWSSRSQKKLIDPDDGLTPAEGALVMKGECEMKQGKCVTLAQLHHDLERKGTRRSRKTA
jgi:hypothetical protein